MRLHRLEVCAFGPYAGTQTVDFDRLGDAGIFLLTGPTGAGKTSVLDAVCYALFGAVPGARQSAKRLRSDHAAIDDRTRVSLELTLRGRRLRITRQSEQERPKQRGSGTTTEKARGTLEELSGSTWTALSTRLDEIGHELESLLGMSREQFCQVVLLPQGEFASFLSADAEQRRELLQRLFATDRFAAVERWLADRRVEADRERRQAVDEVEATLDRLAEAAGVESRPDDVDLTAWCADVVDDVTKRLLVATEAFTAAKVGQQRAKMKHDTARDLAMRQAEHADVVRRTAALEKRRPVLLLAEVELGAARRAATVAPFLTLVQGTHQAMTAARAACAEVKARLRTIAVHPEDEVDPAGAGSDGLREHALDIRDEASRLTGLLSVVAEMRELTTAANEHRAAATAAAKRAEHHDGWLAAFVEKRQILGTQLEHEQRVAALVESRRAEVERAEAALAAGAERSRLEAEQQVADAAVRAAVDRAQQTRADWLDLRERRLSGMAAELAAQLAPDVPCPVCGAVDHPAPASASGTDITAEAEAAAQRAADHADEVRRATEQSLAEVVQALAAATVAAGGGLEVEALTAAATGAHDALAASTAAAGAVVRLAEQIAALESERADHEQHRDTARRLERDQAKDAADSGRRRAQLQARIDEARGDDPTVEARIDRLTALAVAVERVADAADEVIRTTAAYDEAVARAETALTAEGFTTLTDTAAAIRTSAQIDELEQHLRAFADEEAVVTERSTDPELAHAAAQPAPDVEFALVELAEADRLVEAAAAEQGAAKRAEAAVRRLAKQLDGRLSELRPLDEHCRVVTALSRLTEGSGSDNELRMRLSSYVLAARLEHVAAAASTRLLGMSAGRYTLVHTDERDGNNRRSGLGLAVVDGWTGQQRPTSTLSGGETFFASLALALGLADVVTAEAGGTPLETLFVDEGFGSLDDDTLDEVMTVLDGLRSGGRVVGVVSHVADLRQRIPTQLRVTKTSTGSALSVT